MEKRLLIDGGVMMTSNQLIDKVKKIASNISTALISPEDLSSYHKYFEIHYLFKTDNNHKFLLIYLTFKHDDKALLYIEYLFKGDNIVLNAYNAPGAKNKRDLLVFIPYMVNDLADNNEDFRYALYEEYKNLIEEMKKAAEEEFYLSFKDLSEDMDKKERVDVSAPVHLYPLFENFGTYYGLSLKIGRGNKYYIVKDIRDLLNGIKNNTEKRFGKDLSIVLNKHVFDETSQKLIELIMRSVNVSTTPIGRYVNLKSAPISYKVFEIYKGQRVEIDNNSFLVRMNEINVNIHIDKDYKLSLDYPDNYVFEEDLACLLDFGAFIIDQVKGDENFINLLKIINESNYPSISTHIEEFKYSIILRYITRFTYDEAIADEFTFEEILINVYFDLSKEIITYHDEMFDMNGVLIEEKDLNPYNRAQFKRYKHLLSNYGFNDENKMENPSDIWNFLTSDFSELKKVANVYLSDNIQNKVTSVFAPPQIKVNYGNSMLDVLIEESTYSEEDLMKIYQAIKQKKKYIFLRNNVINLEDPSSEDFKNHIDEYDLLEKNKIVTYQKLPVYYAFKSLDGRKGISITNEVKAILSNIKNFKNSDTPIEKIDGELRDYQKDGVRWLTILYQNHLSGILADDMGLGKTIEIIAFLKGVQIDSPILIVCPKSLIFNWLNEFQKFDPKAKIKAIYGNKKEREKIIKRISLEEKVVYITSYDSLRQDEELYMDKHFEIMILDEAQAIKNSKAKKAITVTHINSEVRFVLTGTPIENSVLDLWSIFNFLMPGYLGDIDSFKDTYENGGDDYKARLRKKIAPFILRRNKKDVLKDLPPKYEVVFSSEMNEPQRKVYEAHRLEARNILKGGGKAFDVLYLLTRLRQICIDPSLFIENYHDGSGKIDALMEIVQDKIDEGHRILIFSQFVKALELVEQIFKRSDISYLKITGQTESEERIRITNEFNNNRHYKVVLISLKAGGTGLNLTGADTVIHLDPWWNVAAQEQATDRAHRIGQEKNVEVIKLICQDSIEQRVVELQNIKKELIASLISDDESSIVNLSLEDIGYILG